MIKTKYGVLKTVFFLHKYSWICVEWIFVMVGIKVETERICCMVKQHVYTFFSVFHFINVLYRVYWEWDLSFRRKNFLIYLSCKSQTPTFRIPCTDKQYEQDGVKLLVFLSLSLSLSLSCTVEWVEGECWSSGSWNREHDERLLNRELRAFRRKTRCISVRSSFQC